MDPYPYTRARQGREKQRYDGDTRLVIGCVVIKDNSFLLISSHNTSDKWVLPKGGWEVDETEEEAAKRETFEEAGVDGEVGECISTVTYMNKMGKPVEFRLHVMRLSTVYDWWPEVNGRRRLWVEEKDLSSLHLCELLQLHLPKILDYMHNHSCYGVCCKTIKFHSSSSNCR